MTAVPTKPSSNGSARHPGPQPQLDLLRAQRAAAEFLTALGLCLDTESTTDTPARMAHA